MNNISDVDSVSFKFKDIYYLVNVSSLLAFFGLVIKYLFANIVINGEQGPAFSTLVGYTVTTISLVGMLLAVVSYYFKVKENPKCISVYPSILQIIGTIILLIVIIYQNTAFRQGINENKVSPEFYKFSTYSTILIFVQVVLIFTYLQNNMYCLQKCAPKNPALSTGVLYLSMILFVINSLVVGIMEVILRLFSTCG